MVKLTDCPDMALDVYRGRKTTHNNNFLEELYCLGKQSDGNTYFPFENGKKK